LPGTAVQLKAMAAAFGADDPNFILGQAFNEAQLRALPLQDYRVIVLATHGLLPQSQGSERAVQVSGRTLQPASDTGETDRARGESLAGLARAFFYAGARSLLVSNWEVPAGATVKLMSDTFAH